VDNKEIALHRLIKRTADWKGLASTTGEIPVLWVKVEGADFSEMLVNFYQKTAIFLNYDVENLGRQRRRWVDNIKMDLTEIGWDGMDWIELAQDRDQWRTLVNTVMDLRVP
jgi:hypothetical protein